MAGIHIFVALTFISAYMREKEVQYVETFFTDRISWLDTFLAGL